MMGKWAGFQVAIAGALLACGAGRAAEAGQGAAAGRFVPPAVVEAALSPSAPSLAAAIQTPATAQSPTVAQPPAASRAQAGTRSSESQGHAPETEEIPVVSIERIRALLASDSIFGVERLSPDDLRPVFRSRVEERAFKLPEFVATLDAGFEAVPPGGLTQHEINRLITPDMYRGMAVFTNQEVLRVMALALRNALLLRGLGWAIDKGKDIWADRQVERVREEIRQEIAAIEAEKRRQASRIKRPDSRP